MGSLRGVVLLLTEISVIVAVLFYVPSHAISPLELKAICDKTVDYHFCYDSMATDPRTPDADMGEICLIVVAKTIDRMRATSERIPVLQGQATDPTEKERLRICGNNYQTAVGQLEDAGAAAAAKKFSDVGSWVKLAAYQITICEDMYQQIPPFFDNPPLAVDNQSIKKFESVALAVLDLLNAN